MGIALEPEGCQVVSLEVDSHENQGTSDMAKLILKKLLYFLIAYPLFHDGGAAQIMLALICGRTSWHSKTIALNKVKTWLSHGDKSELMGLK